MNNYFKIALKEAKVGMRNNHGGPFGAVIVKNSNIIATAHNEVIKRNDPTAHAEILAIRKASKKLNNFNLSNCEIYSTCQPCPMCLSAIIWARIKTLYYSCTKEDAANIGFDDKNIYKIINGSKKSKKLKIIKINKNICENIFKKWKNKKDKTEY